MRYSSRSYNRGHTSKLPGLYAIFAAIFWPKAADIEKLMRSEKCECTLAYTNP